MEGTPLNSLVSLDTFGEFLGERFVGLELIRSFKLMNTLTQELQLFNEQITDLTAVGSPTGEKDCSDICIGIISILFLQYVAYSIEREKPILYIKRPVSTIRSRSVGRFFLWINYFCLHHTTYLGAAEFIMALITFGTLTYMYWVLFISGPHRKIVISKYESHSEFAASKYNRHLHREKKVVQKKLSVVNEKKRAGKNAAKPDYHNAIYKLEREKLKYASHSGVDYGMYFTGALWLIYGYINLFRDFLFDRMRAVIRQDAFVDAIISQRFSMRNIFSFLWSEDLSLRRRILGTRPFSLHQQIRLDTSLLRMRGKFNANHVENCCITLAGIITSTSMVNVCSLLASHFKMYYRASVAQDLGRYFTNLLFSDTLETQSFDTIVGFWSNLAADFQSLRKSPLFDKVISVASLLVSSGLCGTFDIDFKLAGFTVFSENLKKRLTGLSIVDMPQLFVEAISYFMETGYLCYLHGSLKPILFTNPEAYEFEMKYLEFYRVYPLVCDGDWEQAGMTYSEFLELYNSLHQYLLSMHSTLSRGFEKKAIWDRLVSLVKAKGSFDRVVNAGVMRKAPFVMSFYGPSSVGKTSIANILNVVAVKACGGTGDLSKKITWNDGDKYFSNYKADTETIVMDDLCNTKPAFTAESPLSRIIKFANNNPEYAVMAELESKGNIAIRPHTVVITTNVADLNASVYSMEPVSILRRINMRVSVTVKPQFAKPNQGGGALMLEPALATAFVSTLDGSDRLFPDMWNLTVERAVPTENPSKGGADIAKWEVVTWKGIPLTDVTLKMVASYTAFAAREYSLLQSTVVRDHTALHCDILYCKECHKLEHDCYCDMVRQDGVGEMDLPELEPAGIVITDLDVTNPPFFLFNYLPFDYSDEFVAYCRYVVSDRFLTDTIRNHYPSLILIMIVLLVSGSCGIHILNLCVIAVVTLLYLAAGTYYIYWRSYRRYVQVRNRIYGTMRTPIFRAIVASGVCVLTYTTIGSLIHACLRLHRRYSLAMERQSALNPDTEEYIKRRSEENVWIPKVKKVKLKDVVHKVKTTDWRDLYGRLERNCVFVRCGTRITGGFFVRTHLLVLPAHFIQEDMNLDIIPRVKNGNNKHSYRIRASESVSYKVPNTDIALVYAPGGTDKYDCVDYFPTHWLNGTSVCSFLYRGKEGVVLHDKAAIQFTKVNTDAGSFEGGEYEFSSIVTFRGLCMGVFVTENKPSCIAGFHLGGITGTRKGACGTLLKSHIYDALEFFDRPGVIFPGNTADVPTIMYDEHLGHEPFFSNDKISPRCPTNHLPEDGMVDVLASCKGAVSSRSSVQVSHISSVVTQITGVENVHGPAPLGPPIVPSWHPWSMGMSGFSTISQGMDTEKIVRVSEDYIFPLIPIFSRAIIRPLDMDTIINGLDNDKFINRMPQNTSVGFPLVGPLCQYSVLKEPSPKHQVNFAVDDAIIEVYTQYKSIYARGERCYPVFRASLKDEPVKIGKLKARVFQAAPVALKMLMREYFLPLAAHLSMYPLVSECAVGINPFSHEWGEMEEWVCHYGMDRIVAGDYSAYDQRMSPSLTSAAFDILIRLAKCSGYSDRDLVIMRSMVADVVYPLLAYNGTLVGLFGSNPSGHNLTVYINSIVNSLISRGAFYHYYPGANDFRTSVAMMTYGDDDVGSVSDLCPRYNNVNKALYVESLGMKYTPPSKDGDHIPYLAIGDVDFLKRSFVYNDLLQRSMGALDIASIYKSLHVRIPSTDVSKEEWAGMVVDGGLREMFPHGEESYEIFRQQMIQVAEECDFIHHSVNISCDYRCMADKIGL